MIKRNNLFIFLCIFIVIDLIGWYYFILPSKAGPSEQSILDIPLNGPITKKKAELSGLTWIADTLILLPQYPERFGPNAGVLFAIPKQSILDFLDGKSKEPISPYTIKLTAPGLKESIQDYEGFESIGVWNQTIYLTIESGKNNNMMGYLVSGTISDDLKEIVLDTSHVVEIQPAIQLDNRTDEALVITNNRIITFFEVNGASLNPQPMAHVFNFDLIPEGTISFPNLEYRVTDATLGPNGEVWVINSVSPNDAELFTKSDPLLKQYNDEIMPADVQRVERLVKLNISTTDITLTDNSPIEIRLGKTSRNWEGLVLLDNRGFLLVTDKHPDTMLGFLPNP